MYEIVIGRSEENKKKWGDKGTVFIGKHYVKMGQTTSLSNKVFLDVATSHVVFICGKRGGGKSYTMGVIAESMAALPKEVSENLSVILLDTMGIYWTMKFPNKKDKELLNEWGLKDYGLDVKIFTPTGYYKEYKKQGIPTDSPFSIKPSELNADDWCTTFEIDDTSEIGVLLYKIINFLQEGGTNYSVEDIIDTLRADTDSDKVSKEALENRFITAKSWGVFSEKGTDLKDLAVGGQVTVLDVSCYATMPGGWKVKALVIGLVSQKLFVERMIARKMEEFEEVKGSQDYFAETKEKQDSPLVWLIIDEAHEFLPLNGKTPASFPLITILREGRQPGISLILASQQPGKIHTDVMTQADTVISHRITAKPDVEALGNLMQSYMREGLATQLDNLPRVKGAALIFDDANEKMYSIKVRPRFTWHGGQSPTAIHKKKKELEF